MAFNIIFILMFSILNLVGCSKGDAGGLNVKPTEAQGDQKIDETQVEAAPRLPDYQCKLTVLNKKGEVEKNCLGSYISNNIFVSAASCYNMLDAGVRLGSLSERTYKVFCYGEDEVKLVNAIAIHPHYYSNSTNTRDGVYETDEINPVDSPASITYNDLALAWTESVNLTNFPKISQLNDAVLTAYDSDSCGVPAFASNSCDASTGIGCYADAVQLSDSSFVEGTCDFKSGLDCFLSSRYKEFSDEKTPLVFTANEVNRSLGDDDLGSGLVCKQNGSDILVGVYTQTNSQKESYNFVNIANKSRFIQSFMDLKPLEFIDKAVTFKLAKEYRERLKVGRQISSAISTVKNPTDIKVSIDPNGLDDAKLFLEYARLYPNDLPKFLSEKNVKTIRIHEDDRSYVKWFFRADQVIVQNTKKADEQSLVINGFNFREWNNLIK